MKLTYMDVNKDGWSAVLNNTNLSYDVNNGFVVGTKTISTNSAKALPFRVTENTTFLTLTAGDLILNVFEGGKFEGSVGKTFVKDLDKVGTLLEGLYT